MKAQALQSKDTAEERVLYMAMDLSKTADSVRSSVRFFRFGRRRSLSSNA